MIEKVGMLISFRLKNLALRISPSLFFILAYVAMDWASYLHPMRGLNITFWNPAPALGVVFALRWGRGVLWPLFLSVLLADFWVRGMPESLLASMLMACLIAAVYFMTGVTLKRLWHSTLLFRCRRDLFLWLLVTGTGVLSASLCFVTTLYLAGLLPGAYWQEALARYSVGDAVGIMVCMPLFAVMTEARLRTRFLRTLRNREMVVILALSLPVLWLALGIGAEYEYRYFYCLFLPVIWAAARLGIDGAIAAAAWVQLGIVATVLFHGFAIVTIFELQMLALAVALVGFFIGTVVDEQRQATEDLRHSLRLAAAGEMAAALAHELNQPLTALTMYGKACEHLLVNGDTGAALQDALAKLLVESNRAADVVRRLRDFFRTGATRLEYFTVAELFSSVRSAFDAKLHQQNITLAISLPQDALLLYADKLQVEVALRNLLSNAVDAVNEQQQNERRIALKAQPMIGDRVCLVVEDSGKGFAGRADRLFEPFVSSKSSGMGLGLAISRAIAEAHGGTLWAEEADHGIFKFILPLEKVDDERK